MIYTSTVRGILRRTNLSLLRWHSTKPPSESENYVNRVRHMDYWQQNDNALEMEFERGKFMLMVDKEPLVSSAARLQFDYEANSEAKFDLNLSPQLATFEYKELETKLREYGLAIGMLNSVLLDVLDPDEHFYDYRPLFGCAVRTMEPPAESGIAVRDLRRQFGHALGGHFMNLRLAMLTIDDEHQRNTLARFQALTRWHLIYRRCPTCTAPLKCHSSKMSATCLRCSRVFYPTISPVAIVLITNEANDHCLLVRHRGSVGSVFTCVAGFAMAGESLHETVRREIAEEVGLYARDIHTLNMSQPWPMPNNSLMTAFTAVANMEDKIEVAPDELERAEWFTRDQVREALERVNSDPYLRGVRHDKSDPETRQVLRYIPPKGAVAHHIIRQWVDQK
uniref:NAD(+) diphosphatase n=1 Tax=Panagrellus redivivus TaxID=6233 RepID=A0A7E4W7H9_PANRE